MLNWSINGLHWLYFKVNDKLTNNKIGVYKIKDEDDAKGIAKTLMEKEIRPALHFDVYKESSYEEDLTKINARTC